MIRDTLIVLCLSAMMLAGGGCDEPKKVWIDPVRQSAMHLDWILECDGDALPFPPNSGYMPGACPTRKHRIVVDQGVAICRCPPFAGQDGGRP